MDEPLKLLAAVAGGIGLGQMLLFWVTRRSRQVDSRDEKALSLETSFLAERRELLASLRTQLASEQARSCRLEAENTTLLHELFSLQKFANEVVAKYDFLRTLNPAANLPAIHLDPPTATPNPEGGHAAHP